MREEYVKTGERGFGLVHAIVSPTPWYMVDNDTQAIHSFIFMSRRPVISLLRCDLARKLPYPPSQGLCVS